MTTRLYLDTRGLTPDKEAPIKVSLNAFGSSAYIGTGIRVLPDQWDRKGGKVIKHPFKTRLNLELSSRKLAIDNAIMNSRRKAGCTVSRSAKSKTSWKNALIRVGKKDLSC